MGRQICGQLAIDAQFLGATWLLHPSYSVNFLLAIPGPANDLPPFLALGAALRKAGHGVTLLTDSSHQTAAAQAQLDFAGIPGAGSKINWAALEAQIQAAKNHRARLEILYAGLAPILGNLPQATLTRLPQHDVLVTTQPFSFLKLAARKMGRKSAVLVFNPNDVPFIDILPEGAAAAPRWTPKFWQRHHLRSAWKAAEKQCDHIVNQVLGATLQAQGLGRFHGYLFDPADRALITASPSFFPPVGALPQNYAYTGFLRGQAAPGERAAAEIAQVRALEQTGAALPVVILANLEQSAARNLFLRLLAFWPQGAPLVVQRSNNAFVADPHRPEVLVVGPAPLEELFTYATIVVHSGNVATTSAALHVGRPQIIFPQSADETWWAQATEKLGVSKILPAETWAASLQNTLETTLRDVKIMRQVADCATRLRAEDGAAATVRALEKL
jgi:UDP:flavonoid glycosyltransferase YjiC (YdhE family)